MSSCSRRYRSQSNSFHAKSPRSSQSFSEKLSGSNSLIARGSCSGRAVWEEGVRMQRKIEDRRAGKIRQILRIEEIPGFGISRGMPGGSEIHYEAIHVTGHVQGVGFRYTALQVAREFEVAG